MHGVALAQPAMELIEELAPLRLGNRHLGRAFSQWAEGVEAREVQSADL
jgi:hypothetical protein